MRLCLLVVASAACRYDFDDRKIDRDATSNAIGSSSDGSALGPCEHAAPTAPVVLTGSTYTFTGFASTTPVPGVSIAVVDRATSAMLATTTSDSSAAYSVSLDPTGSRLDVIIAAADTSHLTTVNYPTLGIVDNTTFDTPLWDTNAIAQIYQAAAVTLDPAASMLNIGVFHCDGTPFEDATVDVTPAPSSLQYIGADGVPSDTQGMTLAPYSYALALNAMPVATTITVNNTSGATFLQQQIVVLGGQFSMRVMMYGE